MNSEQLEAGNAVMPFGQYHGSSLWWVLDENPSYFEWLMGQSFVKAYEGFYKDLLLYGTSDTVQAKLEKHHAEED